MTDEPDFPPAIEAFIRDAASRSDGRAEAEYRWAQQLKDLTNALADGPKRSYAARLQVSLFWIRLHGALEEFPAQREPAYRWREQHRADLETAASAFLTHVRAFLNEAIRLGDQTYLRSAALQRALTYEQRVLVWALRQENAHVQVAATGLTLTKSLVISDLRTVCGKQVTVAELDRILAEQRAIHPDEFEAGVAIARQVRSEVESLADAFDALHVLVIPTS